MLLLGNAYRFVRVHITIVKAQFHQIQFATEAGAVFAFEWPEVSFLTGSEDGNYVIVGGYGGRHGSIMGGGRVDEAVDEK